MNEANLSHLKVRVRFSDRWPNEIVGNLTGESYPKLRFGVILLSLVVGLGIRLGSLVILRFG